ncbi:GNAT family N-acetyltransferase [Yinghuangia seranimata]|uniref:GNAT family N-acetyltransferase n=1 Tax=Yinghuangia seranimata TaxID=408067 RepID=UPI00248BD5C8|nr:GNAT family N-acetyltransferase [Yinghuangia seranimata]MDI2124574.1 GNAT family N-acetyltransferase [Yinghuangia seranimata]
MSAPEVVRLDHYGKAGQAAILGDGPDPFGVADVGFTWLPKELHFGVMWDGRLVAHTGLLRIPVTLAGTDTDVIGVGGVAVATDARGQGLARLVVGAAVDHARTLGPEFGLLFCRPPLVALYERLGWHRVENDVVVEQPDGPAVMPLATMWTPLRDGAAWPDGDLRLRSFPM